jgi:hypothetical protein
MVYLKRKDFGSGTKSLYDYDNKPLFLLFHSFAECFKVHSISSLHGRFARRKARDILPVRLRGRSRHHEPASAAPDAADLPASGLSTTLGPTPAPHRPRKPEPGHDSD